jgi:hypothetical protein
MLVTAGSNFSKLCFGNKESNFGGAAQGRTGDGVDDS